MGILDRDTAKKEENFDEMLLDLAKCSRELLNVMMKYPKQWHLNKIHFIQQIKHDMDESKIDREEEDLQVLATLKKLKEQNKLIQ